ncbi:MAG: MBL fold metallo-hydrolase [Clostridia bacterium]|nr:MBL fold metallo-hydrolase [Clostridia bacterium]
MKRKLLSLFLILALLLPFTGCGTADAGADLAVPADGKTLTVSFLDVGQGDSIFIELPDGDTMLIDASESHQAEGIIDYIEGRGHDTLDYVVATHPHADHIGGMAEVLQAFEVGEIWMPDADCDTKTYENLLETVEEKAIPLHVAAAGKTILSDESLNISLIAPCSDEYSDLNDYSAVISLTYGKTRFIFTGDAEAGSEAEILKSGVSLSADVLKMGHHGSSTSSSEAFVKAVSPKWGIISCGEGNSYGHPHKETLELVEALGIELLRTDLLGTIVMTSDGETVKYGDTESSGNAGGESSGTTTAATEAGEYHWVLNTSSKKIHREDCASAKSISEQNRAASNKSVSELVAEGYTACGSCKPED